MAMKHMYEIIFERTGAIMVCILIYANVVLLKLPTFCWREGI